MPLHRIAAGWVMLFLLLYAGPALAFFDPPWITPESPLAGEVVAVNIRGGYCDSIFFHPDYPQITQEGNAIRLLEYGHHYEPGNELCIYPPGTLIEPLGVFAAGEYTLTVEMAYIDFFGIPQILPIGVVSFTIVAPAAPAQPVPTTNFLSLLILALALSGLVWAMRRHRNTGLESPRPR